MFNPGKAASLTRIGYFKDAYRVQAEHPMDEGATLHGYFWDDPQVGRSFCFGWLITSVVENVIKIDDPAQKVVLPERLLAAANFSLPELKKGDFVIYTMNSLYVLHDIA